MKITQSLEGKRVKVVHSGGEIFIGIVGDYIYPEDNEPDGIASIVLDHCNQLSYPLEIYENEIKQIDIID